MRPGDPLHVPGSESLLVAGSLDQARFVWQQLVPMLTPAGDYRTVDSARRIAALHKPSGTRVRVISSKGKTAMGIVGCPLLIADEPGAWEVVGGQLMRDAIETAQGKPGSPLRVVYIGTLAPAESGWWTEMIDRGSHGSTYVQSLRGNPEKWDRWPEIRRCNPLVAVSAKFRRKLLEQRDKARTDSRRRAQFLSYRLNVPTADEAAVLLTVADWKMVKARPAPDRHGRPVVGVDLGQGRAWSADVAIWLNGRTEAATIAPGVPSLDAQERRDRVPSGTYRRLVDLGSLELADGLRVPPVALLVERAMRWHPRAIVCDRARYAELLDAVRGRCRVITRVSKWDESTADIRGFRMLALDGPLAVDRGSVALLQASLAAARVKSNDSGEVRLVKRDQHNNTSRDDCADAWVRAAGVVSRMPRPRPMRVHVA